MPDFDKIDSVIVTYLAGTANIEEVILLRKWLDVSPEHRAQFSTIKSYWQTRQLKVEANEWPSAFERLQHKIKSEVVAGYPLAANKPKSRVRYWRISVGIAAGFILIALAVAWPDLKKSPVNDPQASTASSVIKQNPAGQKSRIALPDGSVIYLNSLSSVEYPERFSNTLRQVRLVGEAYFEIARDTARPFYVYTDHFDVQVTGTSFNLTAYKTDSEPSITLVEGSVMVHVADQSDISLSPGQQLSYHTKTNEVKTAAINTSIATAWKDGIMVFEQTSFAELKERLENWYGVRILVEGKPPEDFVVRGKFKNESLDNVLTTFQFARPFQYQIKDDDVIISFKNGHAYE
jgi:ferric-dicitrate binding protein FerR (iron transport regulator)